MLERTEGEGPATHIRGTKTIDGVFATNGIYMVQGRYVEFHKSPSDHRWIVLDITESSLLGVKRHDKLTALSRRVTSKIPSVKATFQKLLEKQVLHYDLHYKINRLFNKAMQQNFSHEEELQYEIIEQRMQRAVKWADRHCRRVRRGGIPFSPTQKRLMGAITIIRQLRLRHLLKGKQNRPRTTRIRRLIQKYRYTGKTKFNSVEEIDSALRDAIHEYKSFKRDAQTHRWGYLERIAKEYDELDGRGIQHHFNILQRTEKNKEYFRRIRLCEGKNHGGRVDKIQMTVDGEPRIVSDQRTMEKEIMRVNREKLLQAGETPLRNQQIAQLVGEQGDFKRWEEILKGLVVLPPDIDEGLQLWFNFITSTERHDMTEFRWTTEEYCESWRKMKEEKTTLPGIQVAHLKSLDSSSCAADVMSKLSMIPLLTGYSPSTWRKGIDSMIPKKTADLRPDKLRLILLMDARFNHNNKLIGKKMMEYGERHRLLAPEQYGSRKNKSAIEHATNKRFTLDIIRQSGRSAIYIANDAKSCYDRIILMVAYLTMRNFGIPETVATSTISTILHMRHYVRTSYGDSRSYYGGEKWTVKPHGCGQGNGYGPALWACISSPLLHILRQRGYGTTITTPLSNQFIHLAAFSFVDDTDIIQTGPALHSSGINRQIDDLFNTTQHALTTWSKTLAATGGELEPSKTFYVPILPRWRGSKVIMQTPTSANCLYLVHHNGHKEYLDQKDPRKPFFSLGIWQSPIGDETRQVQHLQDIITQWGNKTDENKMTWHHARLAVRSTIGRTLNYPLTATSLSFKQCQEIQKKFLKTILGKMGIVRTIPSLLAVAPTSLGGFGILSIELEQLLQHVSLILQYGPDKASTTGMLLRSTIEHNVLETGYSGDPIQIPSVPYVTPNTWISHTIASLNKYNIKINSDISRLHTWTHDDVFIMEAFRDYGSATTQTILNKVRMHLQVVTLSDLITADRRFYDTDMIRGIRGSNNPNPSRYCYSWPDIPVPSPAERSIWHSALTYTFQINESQMQMEHEVGNWKASASLYAKWIYSSSEHRLFERESSQRWTIWRPAPETRRHRTRLSSSLFVRSSHVVTQLPLVRILASVRPAPHNMVSLGPVGEDIQATGMLDTSNLRPLYRTFHGPEGIYQYNILMNNGMIYTDGSFANGISTYAWAAQPPHFTSPMRDVDFDSFKWHSDYVFGHTDEQHSYRAELGGILAAIEYTNTLCCQANITTGVTTLICDNKGALMASFGKKRPTPRWTAYDLVRQIRVALASSPIGWKYQHVKGHQDRTMRFERLLVPVQGNVLVDHLASQLLRQSPTQLLLPTHTWSMQVDNQYVGGDLHKRMYDILFRPQMIQFWSRLLKLDVYNNTQCDWDLFFRSLQGHPVHTRFTLIKFMARILPVGTNLKRRRHADTSTCLHCDAEETHEHILQCSHPTMTQTFEDITTTISDLLEGITSQSMTHDIISIVRYFHSPDTTRLQDMNISSRALFQVRLGQNAFFAGLWTTQWCQDQHQYHVNIGSRRDAAKWMSTILNHIQQIPITMWTKRNDLRNAAQTQQDLALQHDHLNSEIDELYEKKPHSRLMKHCDNLYFTKYGKDKIKTMKIHRKTNWVEGAKLIMVQYARVDTPQAARFTSYFQWDRG